MAALLWDGRFALITVALAGFGRAIAEVGAVIIVGVSINHLTRAMTTAITLDTSRGDLPLVLALGFVLLALAVNTLVAVSRMTAQRLHLAQDPREWSVADIFAAIPRFAINRTTTNGHWLPFLPAARHMATTSGWN